VPQPRATGRWNLRKQAGRLVLGLVGLALVIQFVPYGKNRTPVPAPRPFPWHAAQAEAVARAACYDCHSNETRWWWAVKFAPFSWLAQSDIDEGKAHLDFSAWNDRLTAQRVQRALSRDMPPWYYTAVHPEARLNAGQKQILVQGLQTSLDAARTTP